METMLSFSVGVLCAMIWILFYWLVGLQVKQVSNTHQFITKRLQIDMIMNVVGEDLFQARKQFVHSGAKGLAWLYSFKRHEQFLRLALTLKRDASHSCLINLSWRQECTTTTHSSGRGVPFGVTKSCGRSKPQKLPPKADNTFAGHCPQKCLFVGEDLFKPASSLPVLGSKDPHGFAPSSDMSSFWDLLPHQRKMHPTHAL